MAELDANALTQAYKRLLAERGPGFRGIPHEGAAYTSRDPGGPRYREGEVTSDVGFLDPVDFMAGALGPGARNAVKALARLLSRPRPGAAARSFAPEAEGLMGQIDTILDDVRRGMPGDRASRYREPRFDAWGEEIEPGTPPSDMSAEDIIRMLTEGIQEPAPPPMTPRARPLSAAERQAQKDLQKQRDYEILREMYPPEGGGR